MARRTLESLLGDNPQYADSYDVMGKVQMEQGQIAAGPGHLPHGGQHHAGLHPAPAALRAP
jgi:hypothetical protein